MASYRRSFNFRNGVQVDEDNFIVNSSGLVGIGTSVPTEFLDVRGNAVISGTLTVDKLVSSNTQNTNGQFDRINVGITSITSGIIKASTGVITYYGDGGSLLNLPTSQWVDADVGLGFTSIYAQGNVGIATTDPRFVLQIGGNNNVISFVDGVGFDRKGGVVATGVVTAKSFVGYGSELSLIDASNIDLGTLDNARLPSNISVTGSITAGSEFNGNLIGIANTANSITRTSNIFVNSINSGFSTSGISTITNKLHVEGSVGVGTLNPNADIHVRKTGSSTIQITSDGSNPARITFGRNVTASTNNGQIQYGNTNLTYQDSTETSVDIINYSTGNYNSYLHLGSAGINTGSFNWIYGQSLARLMTLTYGGRLGLGVTNPSNTLHVVGTSTVTGDSYFGGNVYLAGGITPSTISVTNNAIFNGKVGISTNNPSYSFQIGREPIYSDGGIGINARGEVYSAGIITARSFVGYGSDITLINPANISSGTYSNNLVINSTGNFNISGIITATRFSGDGSTLTNLDSSNISSGTIGGSVNVNTSGVITATRFAGDGSTLTSLNASNISSGTIGGSVNVNTTGTVTATSFSGNGSNLTALTASNVTGSLNDVDNITTVGIVTAELGFTSGIGTAVVISTIGNKLRFTVNGVGYAEITLSPIP
jgi:hypothetical protein